MLAGGFFELKPSLWRAMNMLLRWNENRVLYIPLVIIHSESDMAKMSAAEKQTAIAPVGAITLLPGINEVKDSEWKIAEPHVLDLLKRKADDKDNKNKIALEVVSFTVGSSKGISTFTKVPAPNARKLLAETFSPFTLQKWEQEEVRESVRVDLKKRMEELNVEPLKVGLDRADDEVTEDEFVPEAKSQPKKAG